MDGSVWDILSLRADPDKEVELDPPPPKRAGWRTRIQLRGRVKQYSKKRGIVSEGRTQLFYRNGRYVRAYSRSWLADYVGVSMWAVRSWVKFDHLPRSPLHDERGTLYYTEMMSFHVREAYLRCGGKVGSKGFSSHIEEQWTRMGYKPDVSPREGKEGSHGKHSQRGREED